VFDSVGRGNFFQFTEAKQTATQLQQRAGIAARATGLKGRLLDLLQDFYLAENLRRSIRAIRRMSS
jgi:hypothetical protein